MRRWAAAIALAALVTPAWPAASAGAAPATLCSPGESGGRKVAIVVDDGESTADARCIEIPDSVRNGTDFLLARAQILGTPPPRFHRNGLVCSIDGKPETGCGEQTGDTYAYWSYWDGRSGSWVFSRFGPGARRMTNSSVEGWRFQSEGTLAQSGQPPGFPADRDRICPPDPPPDDDPPTDNPPPDNPPTDNPPPDNPPPDNPPVDDNTPPANPPTDDTPPPGPAKPTPESPLTVPRQRPATPQTKADTTAKRRSSPPTTSPTGPTTPTTASPTGARRQGAPAATAPVNDTRDGGVTRQPAPNTLPRSKEESGGVPKGAPAQPGATLPRAPDTIAGVSPNSNPKAKPTTTIGGKPVGGPTTLAQGDGDDPPGRVTNVAQAGDLAVPGSKRSSTTGWWGLGVGVGAIGASGVSARWMRRRRLP